MLNFLFRPKRLRGLKNTTLSVEEEKRRKLLEEKLVVVLNDPQLGIFFDDRKLGQIKVTVTVSKKLTTAYMVLIIEEIGKIYKSHNTDYEGKRRTLFKTLSNEHVFSLTEKPASKAKVKDASRFG
jgi:hypothetical protein